MSKSTLKDWNDIADQQWQSLLLGNGASCAVWKDFSYSSLYEEACRRNLLHDVEKNLFKKLKTVNFETVIDVLSTASQVCQHYKMDQKEVKKSKKNIRDALIKTIKEIHIPWVDVKQHQSSEEEILEILGKELIKYRNVFTTNYDLLSYWSIMESQLIQSKVNDCFRAGGRFKKLYIKTKTNLFFLHGGLHLYIRPNGQTVKRKAQEDSNLLELFSETFDDASPLIIAEGSYKEKHKQIKKSDYLRFSYEILKKSKGSLVIFGHRLDDKHDGHITKIFQGWKDKKIAVAIHEENPKKIVNEKRRFCALLGGDEDNNIIFFKSRTHPLGAETLRI